VTAGNSPLTTLGGGVPGMGFYTVVVPWQQPTGEGSLLRERTMRTVCTHLTESLQHWTFTPPLADWSRGAARNAGALTAQTPVVVFNDADTIVSKEQIERAAHIAYTSDGLVYAYDLYLRLTEASSEAMMRGEQPHWPIPEDEFVNAPSMGCAAISLACFRELGGFDEQFRGWGYEDVDFAWRAGERWPVRRVPGPAFHLWHGGRRDDDSPLDADPVEVLVNKAYLIEKDGDRG